MVRSSLAQREALKARTAAAAKAAGKPNPLTGLSACASWTPSALDQASLEKAGVSVGVLERREPIGEEAAALQVRRLALPIQVCASYVRKLSI